MTQFTAESDHAVILIVDNKPTALRMKSQLLNRQGYRIIEATNGADALTVAAAERPALILLDVNLSDINGFDICRQLKTRPETQFIKVLQTSAAHINAPDRMRGLEGGADAYLVEPAEEEELIGTMRALLKLARHERDNQRLIERLTESEMRYRSLVERMPVAMYTIDRDGRITFYNDQAAELWGCRPNPGHNENRFYESHKLLWPDGTPLPHDKTPMADAVRDGIALHDQEFILERPDGTRRHVIIHIDPLRNAEGHIIGAVNLFTDITVRRETEDALRDAERRYRAIFEQAGVGVAQIDSRTGRFERVNRKYCEIVGRTEAEMLATTFMNITHPDDLAEDLAGMKHLRGGLADSFAMEKRYVRKDGAIVWVLLNVAPLRKPGEELSHHIVVVQCITERKRAEERLRESEARLRLAMQGAGLASWEMDLRTGVNQWDERLPVLLGVEKEAREASARWWKFIHPNDRARVLKAFTAACEGRGVFHTHFRMRHQDGSLRWFTGWGHLVEDNESKRMVGLVQDITEPKRRDAHQAFLAEVSEDLARPTNVDETMDALGAEIGTYFNASVCAFGEVNEEQRLIIVANEWKRADSPSWKGAHRIGDYYSEDFRRACRTGVIYVVRDAANDARTNAEQMAALSIGSFVSVPLVREGEWRFQFVIADAIPRDWRDDEIELMRELTTRIWIRLERAHAEAALRESETRFKTLADSTPVLMWMNDREGARFVNRAYLEFLGITDQVDAAKYDWAVFVHPEDRHRYLQAYLSAFEKHALLDEQFRFRRHDGRYRWMRSVGQPRHSASGELLGYVGATYDITEIKEAQERLERWSIELERAVNVKTAELQQSQDRLRALTSELNLAEQRERKRLATELHDHLQQMLVLGKLTIGQGRRAANGVPTSETILKKVDDILSDALTYSRTLVAELSPPVLRDHGLAASLKWLAEYMKKKHEQTVTVVMPDDQGPNLPEDQRVLLFQSVRELLINSAKHAGTGQAILTMEKRVDHLCMTVKDEGAGFDLAAAAEARVPSGEISSKFGLYSIQERMRALGGSFTIHSAPGQGAIATLIMPLARSVEGNEPYRPVTECEDASAAVRADEADSLTMGQMMVPVLLVDDHAMVRQGLRSVLDTYADIQVVGEAGDGTEAVKSVEKLRPRVVVMDINMPKMNGIEATTQIKAKWPDTIIIGISVNIGDNNGDAMQRAGAVTLITKEAAVEQLHDTIVHAIGSQDTQGGPVIRR